MEFSSREQSPEENKKLTRISCSALQDRIREVVPSYRPNKELPRLSTRRWKSHIPVGIHVPDAEGEHAHEFAHSRQMRIPHAPPVSLEKKIPQTPGARTSLTIDGQVVERNDIILFKTPDSHLLFGRVRKVMPKHRQLKVSIIVTQGHVLDAARLQGKDHLIGVAEQIMPLSKDGLETCEEMCISWEWVVQLAVVYGNDDMPAGIAINLDQTSRGTLRLTGQALGGSNHVSDDAQTLHFQFGEPS